MRFGRGRTHTSSACILIFDFRVNFLSALMSKFQGDWTVALIYFTATALNSARNGEQKASEI